MSRIYGLIDGLINRNYINIYFFINVVMAIVVQSLNQQERLQLSGYLSV